MMNWKGVGSGCGPRYYPGSFLEGLRKAMISLSFITHPRFDLGILRV